MYETLLLIHSWMRWAIVVAVLYFFVNCLAGSLRKKLWSPNDQHFIWAFNQLFGFQVVFGIIIWLALSPFTKAGFKTPITILENPVTFFWTIRHPVTMLLAMAAFQIGETRAKKTSPEKKHKLFAITFAVLILLIASAIPWPGLAYGRTFFRWPVY